MIVRFVAVTSGVEVSRAELADDGTITYGGGETAAAVVATAVRDRAVSAAEAVRLLAVNGWSNGYIMVDLG